MKIMISQPMNGKNNEQIEQERKAIVEKLKKMHIDVVNTIFNFELENVINEPVYYLAKSIEAMANVDAVLFMNNWQMARGCLIEHMVAEKYKIKILYEDFVTEKEAKLR